ncbi:hypothetical protein PLICRDRAFT_42690 [Plicaturopsis crispa FD-325 SS-3]|nr:hypothetical protein PLICRDRAFT_42690 [Plicaturopsis crispa FD-325 SS-3]
MDRQFRNKKIVDLTEQELLTLGFLGDNALPGVRDMVQVTVFSVLSCISLIRIFSRLSSSELPVPPPSRRYRGRARSRAQRARGLDAKHALYYPYEGAESTPHSLAPTGRSRQHPRPSAGTSA